MMRELEIVENFAQLRILVVGEAMLDAYLDGSSGRICREAPVPVVNVAARRVAPGGAGNAACNLASLGAQVEYLSVVGNDAAGSEVVRSLAAAGVNPARLIRHPARTTLVKHRVVADGQLLVRFDEGDEGLLDAETEAQLCSRLAECYPRCDAVIVSDYGLGVMTPAVIACLRHLQALHPRLLVVDARRLTPYCQLGMTAVKPNYEEACRFLDLSPAPGERAELMRVHGERILERTGAQLAAITLDAEGAVVLERNGPPYRTYGRRVPPSQAAGAGDTFVCALTLALAAGAQTTMAAELAAAAATLVVTKPGTACCTVAELREHLAAGGKAVIDNGSLAERLALYRAQGRRIVFTNGCFDILHRGHVTYLSRAKALGDVLIVGINSDASVQRLKGPGRPINKLEDRVQVLAALSCIDHIVPFDGDTAAALIELVRPDVFVKGADYAHTALPEAPLVAARGGRVVLLDYLADYSTTRIIEHIAHRRDLPATDAEGTPHGPKRLEPGSQPVVR